jgi:hypothetical protein
MPTPARFISGVTTNSLTNSLGSYGLPAPMDWHTYFNDFDTYVAADWTVSETGTGSRALTSLAGACDGGVLLITNAAADDDRNFLQKVGESFLFVANKRMLFKARFKVSDATQSDIIMGLQITDTTPLAVSNGVFFQKDDGDAFLDFHVTKASTDTAATAVYTLVSDTFLTVAFAYDGKGEIKYYVNDVHLGSSVTTNMPDVEELTVSFGIQNGEAVAKTMSIDYIFAASER